MSLVGHDSAVEVDVVSGDRLLDASDVAALLSVPVSWVRDHTRSGAIPHLELGRYVRYEQADVLAWLETCRAGGGPSFRKHRPVAC